MKEQSSCFFSHNLLAVGNQAHYFAKTINHHIQITIAISHPWQSSEEIHQSIIPRCSSQYYQGKYNSSSLSEGFKLLQRTKYLNKAMLFPKHALGLLNISRSIRWSLFESKASGNLSGVSLLNKIYVTRKLKGHGHLSMLYCRVVHT